MNEYRNLTLLNTSKFSPCFLVLVVALVTILTEPALSQISRQKIYNKERNILIKNFGITLPSNFKQFDKYKLKKGITYLSIQMSEQDSKRFIPTTLETARPKGVLADVEDSECRKKLDCPRIGSVFLPSDIPNEAYEGKNFDNFQTDTTGSFRLIKNNRYTKYASFFFDSKNGFLTLWYKT